MNWIAMGLGILGGILNARLNIWGFVAWLMGNSLWMYIYWGQDWAVVGQFAFFNAISCMGIYNWRKNLTR